jgi:hypothetical protein
MLYVARELVRQFLYQPAWKILDWLEKVKFKYKFIFELNSFSGTALQ